LKVKTEKEYSRLYFAKNVRQSITQEDLKWDYEGKKSAGKPKKNWVDCLEEGYAQANIPIMDRKDEK
jgi:hypothetical protein